MDDTYWPSRSGLNYYRVVTECIERFSPGESILDVGCGPTPIVMRGDFKRRFTVDLYRPGPPGVTSYIGDWLGFDAENYSVITCLQVLEHLDNATVVPFARKLLRHADTLIVSVPYKWPRGECEHHLQDPVTFDTLNAWMGRRPDEQEIIDDGKLRLVAIYEGGDL